MRRWMAVVIAAGSLASAAGSCTADTFTSDGGDASVSDGGGGDGIGPPSDAGCACDSGTCVSGLCLPPMGDTPCLAMGQGDGHVYWTDGRTNGTVYRMTTDGTDVVQPLAANQTIPRAIAVDSTNVFWATLGTIMSANLSGGSLKTIQSGMPSRATALALDANNVYWGLATGGIYGVPRNVSNATPTIVAPTIGPVASIHLSGNLLFWTANSALVDGGSTCELASVDVTNVAAPTYYLNASSGVLRGFVVFPSQIYVSHPSGAEILFGGRTAGSTYKSWIPTTAAFDLGTEPQQQNIYWSMDLSTGSIAKSPASTTPSQTIVAPNETNPSCIAFDATKVWWVSGSHVIPWSAPQ